ncbi:hypothetical protein BDV26DRAFT_224 [Aspergillus bertholletiae]|uniref:Nucleolar protein Dnt1-like N-terminal domain-containing protein n=1 Tax=Aspergillus bertholletiae TaxID=1226010 RepID=A0A5N7BQ57_9EURO|nr:hypothetical protein BDV26DRAFT_224 [Aspergillus bertholletiae]
MVFLRLIVKVYPREQLSRPLPTPTNKKQPNVNHEPETKPASFLLALPNPDTTSLGQLAGLIHAKWAKLRPNAEPLDIKKLLDDSHDSVDLDVDMSVADVWVNKARARLNEDDQIGTVRVVQKPAPYAPVRFPSVDQDWGVTREEKFKGKFEPIKEVRESETESGSEEEEDDEEEESEESEESEEDEKEINGGMGKFIDAQAMSVEDDDDEDDDGEEEETDDSGEEEDSGEESESGSEEAENDGQANGHATAEKGSADEDETEEELAPDNDVRMEDSLPETRVLKRKLSPEELQPKKQPRLEQSSQATAADAENINDTPVSSPLGTRKRDTGRVPSFSELGRRLSFTERPAQSHGLGLGITKSPPRKKPFLIADLLQDSTKSESVQNDTRLSPTSVPPISTPTIRRSPIDQNPSTPLTLQNPGDKVRLLQSALRKGSSSERSPERRSVSFADGEEHAIRTSVPATKSISSATDKKQNEPTRSASSQPTEQTGDKDGVFSAEVNVETNEYERELQAKDHDQKSEYTRKLKLAAKKWQVMKNNENKPRKREKERYRSAVSELKKLHQEIVELKEFNAPPSQLPKPQAPNGTPGTRKLSRESSVSQNRKPEQHWDVEIATPRPNSKELLRKDLPSSQTSRKSQLNEEAQGRQQIQELWDIEISTPQPDSNSDRRPEPRKQTSKERPTSPPSETDSEESGSEDERTPKQPEPKIAFSQEKPPSPPADSEAAEESSSEEEEENTTPRQPKSTANLSPPVVEEVSMMEPVPEPEPSGSEEEETDEKEDEEDEEDEEDDESTDKESQDEDDDEHEEQADEKAPKTTTLAQPNPPPTRSPSKPDPADEETDSGSDSDEEDSENESEKENQPLPVSTPMTKPNLRRTSLNLPSSQPIPPSSQQQPTSSQSTPTGSRPARNTLKTLLFQQRAEQEQARRKKEEEAQKRKPQAHKDIFSGPSDSESDEDESDSDSDSDSDSGADAGDILSSGRIGRLRTALPRK